MKQRTRLFLVFCFTLLLTGCGFHLPSEAHLAPPLYRLYIQTNDPYGHLVRNLKQYLRMSKVELVNSPENANSILAIQQDAVSQELLSVNSTQQTRQFRLRVTVVFEIKDPHGKVWVGPQTLSETRNITIQSNQILGSSNEANLFYQHMRRSLAYAIINRIASKEITQVIVDAGQTTPTHENSIPPT